MPEPSSAFLQSLVVTGTGAFSPSSVAHSVHAFRPSHVVASPMHGQKSAQKQVKGFTIGPKKGTDATATRGRKRTSAASAAAAAANKKGTDIVSLEENYTEELRKPDDKPVPDPRKERISALKHAKELVKNGLMSETTSEFYEDLVRMKEQHQKNLKEHEQSLRNSIRRDVERKEAKSILKEQQSWLRLEQWDSKYGHTDPITRPSTAPAEAYWPHQGMDNYPYPQYFDGAFWALNQQVQRAAEKEQAAFSDHARMVDDEIKKHDDIIRKHRHMFRHGDDSSASASASAAAAATTGASSSRTKQQQQSKTWTEERIRKEARQQYAQLRGEFQDATPGLWQSDDGSATEPSSAELERALAEMKERSRRQRQKLAAKSVGIPAASRHNNPLMVLESVSSSSAGEVSPRNSSSNNAENRHANRHSSSKSKSSSTSSSSSSSSSQLRHHHQHQHEQHSRQSHQRHRNHHYHHHRAHDEPPGVSKTSSASSKDSVGNLASSNLFHDLRARQENAHHKNTRIPASSSARTRQRKSSSSAPSSSSSSSSASSSSSCSSSSSSAKSSRSSKAESGSAATSQLSEGEVRVHPYRHGHGNDEDEDDDLDEDNQGIESIPIGAIDEEYEQMLLKYLEDRDRMNREMRRQYAQEIDSIAKASPAVDPLKNLIKQYEREIRREYHQSPGKHSASSGGGGGKSAGASGSHALDTEDEYDPEKDNDFVSKIAQGVKYYRQHSARGSPQGYRYRPHSAPAYQLKWKNRVTVPKPFSFLSRAPKETRAKQRFEEEIRAKKEAEEEVQRAAFKAKPPPLSSVVPRYAELADYERKRRENAARRHNLIEKKKQRKRQEEETKTREAAKTNPHFVPFKANPIPESSLNEIFEKKQEIEEAHRLIRVHERAQHLLQESRLPSRMQQDAERRTGKHSGSDSEYDSRHGDGSQYSGSRARAARRERRRRRRAAAAGAVDDECTFKPQINHAIPDFYRLQSEFEAQLFVGKELMRKTLTVPKPFALHDTDGKKPHGRSKSRSRSRSRSKSKSPTRATVRPTFAEDDAVPRDEYDRVHARKDQRWPFGDRLEQQRHEDKMAEAAKRSPASPSWKSTLTAELKAKTSRKHLHDQREVELREVEAEARRTRKLREMSEKIKPRLKDVGTELEAARRTKYREFKRIQAKRDRELEQMHSRIERHVAERPFLFEQDRVDRARRDAIKEIDHILSGAGVDAK